MGFRTARKSHQSHGRLSEHPARAQGSGHLSSVGATDRY
jgi:hypothetical protein